MVPSPLARNPFGGFVLFLAAGRNKLIIIGQLQVLKQRSLHFFRNVLLSEVKQGRPGLLVQFTGFFFSFIWVYRVRLFFGQAHFWKPS